MSKYIRLKCGSHLIEDGTSYFAIFVGATLFITGLSILAAIGLQSVEVSDRVYYSPMDGQNMGMIFPIVLAISIAEILIINGATRSERVRCRKCGTIWTPPNLLKRKIR